MNKNGGDEMSLEEKIQRYKNTNFKCPICKQAKLDYIQQKPSRRLDYICSNQDCRAQLFFDKLEDQWYWRTLKEISEPEKWESESE